MRIITTLLILMFCSHVSIAQDTLSLKDVEANLYRFEIQNGMLIGDGADFLKSEFAKHHMVLLGEYHGSKAISDFTSAIIPELNKNNFKNFGLEVGPVMGEVLNSLTASELPSRIKEYNQKYAIPDDGDIYTPIPFFENIEDANFLQLAKQNEWNVFGIDQEFYDSYVMLFDLMYENLSTAEQAEGKAVFTEARDSLNAFYLRELINGDYYLSLIRESEIVAECIKLFAKTEHNHSIIEAFENSFSIYQKLDNNQFYENYESRVAYMKSQLAQHLSVSNYDFKNDKLLMKMGALHLSKGISPYAQNEVGNTLHELAEYNGVSALGIEFGSRFYFSDGEIQDELDLDDDYVKEYSQFKKFGHKTQWTILDLRPMRKAVHWYPQPLLKKVNQSLQELINNYDILIITPATEDPSPNY